MIVIDYKDRRPIYEQVVERFQDLIVKNVIRAGEQMPSVRSLAMELAINPNTIQKAYAELERRGFTYTVKGRGSFVSAREEFLEYTQKEVLESFRNDVDDAKNLQIAKSVLTDIIDRCYEGTEKVKGTGSLSGEGKLQGEKQPPEEKQLSERAEITDTGESFHYGQHAGVEESVAVNERQPEEERSRA